MLGTRLILHVPFLALHKNDIIKLFSHTVFLLVLVALPLSPRIYGSLVLLITLVLLVLLVTLVLLVLLVTLVLLVLLVTVVLLVLLAETECQKWGEGAQCS